VEVLLKSESSSWTTPPEALSATSRAQVRFFSYRIPACPKISTPLEHLREIWRDLEILGARADISFPAVREDDILCLLESEREARRLR
jgi:hypothetical protein